MKPFRAALAALILSSCTTPQPTDPATLMAYAWAQPYRDLGDNGGPWIASPVGLCRNKVLWVMARCRCGRPIIGWREIALEDGRTRREFHMALYLPEDHVVVDYDGIWPAGAYPMELDTLDWSPRYGGTP
jgi:hypothetical protein